MTCKTKYTPELANYLKSIHPNFRERYQPNIILLFSDKSCGAYNSYGLDYDEVSTGEFIDRCHAAWNEKSIRLSSGTEVKLSEHHLFFKSCALSLTDFTRIKEGVDNWLGMWSKKRLWTKYACPRFTKYIRGLKNSGFVGEHEGKLVLSPDGKSYDKEVEDVTVSDGEFLDAVNKLNLDAIRISRDIQIEITGVRIPSEYLSF